MGVLCECGNEGPTIEVPSLKFPLILSAAPLQQSLVLWWKFFFGFELQIHDEISMTPCLVHKEKSNLITYHSCVCAGGRVPFFFGNSSVLLTKITSSTNSPFVSWVCYLFPRQQTQKKKCESSLDLKGLLVPTLKCMKRAPSDLI